MHSMARYPALAGQVLTGDGSLHKFVNVYLNDDDVRYLDKLDDQGRRPDDVVSILPAVAGRRCLRPSPGAVVR